MSGDSAQPDLAAPGKAAVDFRFATPDDLPRLVLMINAAFAIGACTADDRLAAMMEKGTILGGQKRPGPPAGLGLFRATG